MSEKPRDLTAFVGPIRMRAEDVHNLRRLAELNERTVSAEIRLAVRRHIQKESHESVSTTAASG